MSVNVPLIASVTSNSRINPPFIHAHLTGGADIDSAAYNATTGSLPVLMSPHQAQINASTALLLAMRDHHFVLGCQSSVSVFTVDYDAPL